MGGTGVCFMNEFHVLYMHHDDAEQRPLFEAMLHSACDTMRREGTFAQVFHDGAIATAEDMTAALLRPGVIPVAAFDATTGEMAALAWLNGHEWRAARGHFVFFRKYWGRKKSVPLGRTLFGYLLGLKDTEGYLFDVLLGITPASNGLAWRRAVECGAELVGTIPRFCFMAESGETMDAVLVAVTRQSLEKAA